MLEKLIGPKYTLKEMLLILEKGLRSGEITLQDAGETKCMPTADRKDALLVPDAGSRNGRIAPKNARDAV